MPRHDGASKRSLLARDVANVIGRFLPLMGRDDGRPERAADRAARPARATRPSRDDGRPGPTGWSNALGAPRKPRIRRHLPTLLLLFPLAMGLLGAPANTGVARGDELSDAKAKQAALKKQVAQQQAQIAAINDLQHGLAAEIADTRQQLAKIGTDLASVRKKIVTMQDKIDEVKAAYAELVAQLADMDAELQRLQGEEAQKRIDLADKRAQLADRVRSAYDTDRTSPLETFISGGSFTDLLAEMSYYIDVGEADKALADQISKDKETLAALHQTVSDTRSRTNVVRQETAAQKRDLDQAMRALQETKAELRRLERQVAKSLQEQKARYAALAQNKRNASAIIARAAAQQKRLASEIDDLIARQVSKGNIPSQFNGSMRWPMDSFTISGEYGCSSFDYYPPSHGCAHFHNGIDLVSSYGAPIKAAAAGEVVYVGWNWADGADPAWIVVIAHAGNLKTWYAHMQPRRPVAVGDSVKKGQIIGYEGDTGHATGAHLHWMVELNGDFVNPRLFV